MAGLFHHISLLIGDIKVSMQSTEAGNPLQPINSQAYWLQKVGGSTKSLIIVIYVLCSVLCLLPSIPSFAQDDMLQYVEKKQKELKQREEQVASEERKLNALKKDVEEKMGKYTKLLIDLDNKLKEVEKIRGERLGYIVKVYESMPPEEAAAKLDAVDDETATQILMRMKSKRAASVMANMDSKKAATITYSMTKIEKNIPQK